MGRVSAIYTKLGRLVGTWPLLVFSGFLAVNSLLFTAGYRIGESGEKIYYNTGGALRNIAVLALFILLVYMLQDKKILGCKLLQHSEYPLFVFYLALGMAWVLIARVSPIDEPLNMSETAIGLMQGEYTALQEGGYAHLFPFQLGFVFYLELVYRVFGLNNYLATAMLNVVFAALSYLCMVKITRRLFPGPLPALLCSLLLFFSVYLIPYTTFLYGILPGLCFALFSVLCALRYLQCNQLRWLVASATLSTLATILKNNYLIFGIGIFLVLAGHWLRTPRLAAILLSFALLAGNLFGIQAVYALYKTRSGIDINSGVPLQVWVAMGLAGNSEIGPGWYNGMTYNLYKSHGYDSQATAKAAVENIAERGEAFRTQPRMAAGFFYRKLMSEWNEPSYGSFISTWPAVARGPNAALLHRFFGDGITSSLVHHILGSVHFLLYAGTLLCLWLRRRSLTLPQLLPAIIVLGGILFFLIWEAKAQYVLPYALLLSPYVAAGFAGLAEPLKALYTQKNQK